MLFNKIKRKLLWGIGLSLLVLALFLVLFAIDFWMPHEVNWSTPRHEKAKQERLAVRHFNFVNLRTGMTKRDVMESTQWNPSWSRRLSNGDTELVYSLKVNEVVILRFDEYGRVIGGLQVHPFDPVEEGLLVMDAWLPDIFRTLRIGMGRDEAEEVLGKWKPRFTCDLLDGAVELAYSFRVNAMAILHFDERGWLDTLEFPFDKNLPCGRELMPPTRDI